MLLCLWLLVGFIQEQELKSGERSEVGALIFSLLPNVLTLNEYTPQSSPILPTVYLSTCISPLGFSTAPACCPFMPRVTKVQLSMCLTLDQMSVCKAENAQLRTCDDVIIILQLLFFLSLVPGLKHVSVLKEEGTVFWLFT